MQLCDGCCVIVPLLRCPNEWLYMRGLQMAIYVAIVSTCHANITVDRAETLLKRVEFSSIHAVCRAFHAFIICQTHNSHAFMLDNCKFTLRLRLRTIRHIGWPPTGNSTAA